MNANLPPGVTLRPATMADLDAVLAVYNACSQAIDGRTAISRENLRRDWTQPGFSLQTHTRCAITTGRLAAFVSVWDNRPPHVAPFIWLRVHPDYRQQGLEGPLLKWAEGIARQSIANAPPGAQVAATFSIHSGDDYQRDLLEANGYRLIRHMIRMGIGFDAPPPAPEWPAGFSVRHMIAGQDDRAIFQAQHEAFADHWGEPPQLDDAADYQRWRHRYIEVAEFDPTIYFLAMDGEQVAGVVLCEEGRAEFPDFGWVRILAVRRAWRQRGLGKALLLHAFGELYRRGWRQAGLGVDAGNLTGALRLYTGVGMSEIYRLDRYAKELRPGVDLLDPAAR